MASSIAFITQDHKISEIKNVYKASDSKTNIGTIKNTGSSVFKTPKLILDGENIPNPGHEHYDGTPRTSIISSNYGEGFLKSKYSTDDYKISTDSDLSTIIEKINRSVFIPNTEDNVRSSFEDSSKFYNRFKVANPNAVLQKGYAHVFFVRPSCNILDKNGTKLREGLEGNELFEYAWRTAPDMLRQISASNGYDHDFMLTLCNNAASFSLSDEYINTDTYGRTYTGYKIAYGKNNVDSKTAGTFNITFNDDRNLHIYQIHRLWVEYINAVYRGEIKPTNSNIFDKILDYVGACYYFLTAEDGETIIFWSKYYGIFPTTIPATQYSWGAGNLVNNTQLDITYQYSFKTDFNPYTIYEFNYNSRLKSSSTEKLSYIPVYNKEAGQIGDTWVGPPFIERVIDDETKEWCYKLRFKPKTKK